MEDGEEPLELPIRSNKRNQQVHEDLRPRDPRFDPKCSGSNDRRHFVRNYAFLDEVKKAELNELQNALKKERDEEKKAKIKMTISRSKNKMVSQQRPQQKTRGKFKKLELANKFKELKETGKLTKYLERKRKKILKRDMKSFG